MVLADKIVVGAVDSTLVQITPEALTGWPKFSFCSVVPIKVCAEESLATELWGNAFNPLSTVVVVLGHCSGVSSTYGMSCGAVTCASFAET